MYQRLHWIKCNAAWITRPLSWEVESATPTSSIWSTMLLNLSLLPCLRGFQVSRSWEKLLSWSLRRYKPMRQWRRRIVDSRDSVNNLGTLSYPSLIHLQIQTVSRRSATERNAVLWISRLPRNSINRQPRSPVLFLFLKTKSTNFLNNNSTLTTRYEGKTGIMPPRRRRKEDP